MKKNPARFTVKFNPTNPRHQKAITLLECAGRCKASLIADALVMYDHYGANMAADLIAPRPQDSILTSQHYNSTVAATPMLQELAVHATSSGVEQPTKDDIWQAVSNAMQTFFDN